MKIKRITHRNEEIIDYYTVETEKQHYRVKSTTIQDEDESHTNFEIYKIANIVEKSKIIQAIEKLEGKNEN